MSAEATFIVRGVRLDSDEGLVIEYLDPIGDVRSNGLVLNHVLFVPAEEFSELFDQVEQAVTEALTSALASFADALSLVEQADRESEPNPYDNPLER